MAHCPSPSGQTRAWHMTGARPVNNHRRQAEATKPHFCCARCLRAAGKNPPLCLGITLARPTPGNSVTGNRCALKCEPFMKPPRCRLGPPCRLLSHVWCSAGTGSKEQPHQESLAKHFHLQGDTGLSRQSLGWSCSRLPRLQRKTLKAGC